MQLIILSLMAGKTILGPLELLGFELNVRRVVCALYLRAATRLQSTEQKQGDKRIHVTDAHPC